MMNGRSGDTYHISTDNVISIRDLVEKICKKLGADFSKSVEVVGDRLGKDSAYHLDSSKLRNELNWTDHNSLDEGLDQCINWIKNNLAALKEQPFDYIHKP